MTSLCTFGTTIPGWSDGTASLCLREWVLGERGPARSDGDMAVSMPVGDEFRVLAAEGLSNVAVPADGLVGGEDRGNLLGPELVPLGGGVIGSHQGWGMIEVIEALERFVAIDAVLAFVPVGHDIPEQAIRGIGFDLLQALLAAVLALGPAGAAVQTEGGIADKRGQACFSCSDINRFRLVGFGAGDQALAAKGEIRSQGWDGSEKDHSGYDHND